MVRIALSLLFTFGALAGISAELPTVETQFGATLKRILAEAQSTEIFRLTGDSKKDRDEVNWKRGPVLDRERTRQIAQKLLSDETYLFSVRAECKPRYGMLLRVSSQKESATVQFCFECGFLCLQPDGPEVDFSPSNAYWTKLAKESFPDDPAIQALKGKDMPLEEKKRLDARLLDLARELEEKKAKKDKDTRDGEKK